MREPETRSAFGAVGSGVLGIGLGLGILGIGFAVSQLALPESAVAATSATTAPTAQRTVTPTQARATAAPTTAPTVAATPTPRPSPTADPMAVSAYEGQGLRLAAIKVPAGYTMTSPIAGRVSVALYQYVDGEIRTGVADRASYPYVFVRSADREVKLRPGAVDTDIQLIVKDGDTVAAGAPLFKTITNGASSWATFYDSGVTAQVVVSAIALPSGVEVDPVPLFKR